MSQGGPPRDDVGPTQGWAGGPPSAPGPRARTDAQEDAERVARRTGEAPEGSARRDHH